METKERATLGVEMADGRPRYESPRVLCLNDLRVGAGMCTTGDGDDCCCEPTGNSAGIWCDHGSGDGACYGSGSTASGCKPTGNAAECACSDGSGVGFTG